MLPRELCVTVPIDNDNTEIRISTGDSLPRLLGMKNPEQLQDAKNEVDLNTTSSASVDKDTNDISDACVGSEIDRLSTRIDDWISHRSPHAVVSLKVKQTLGALLIQCDARTTNQLGECSFSAVEGEIQDQANLARKNYATTFGTWANLVHQVLFGTHIHLCRRGLDVKTSIRTVQTLRDVLSTTTTKMADQIGVRSLNLDESDLLAEAIVKMQESMFDAIV